MTDTAAQSSTGQPPAKSMKGASFWITFGRWVCIIAAKHTLLWGDERSLSVGLYCSCLCCNVVFAICEVIWMLDVGR